MADATPDEFEGERVEALVDVHQQAVVAPVALGREVDDELWPLTRGDRLQFKDEHVAKLHAALSARSLIKDAIGGVSLLYLQCKALPYHANAVDGVYERLRLRLQNIA